MQQNFKQHAIGAAVATLLASLAAGAAAQNAPNPDDGGKIIEVMVTAQRIAQPASKTPLSLSVVSGDDLKSAGAVNAASLTELVPNVQIANNGGATTIAIRGVTSADNTEKGDPSASFNIDGVNLARPQSAGLAFYDLERIEVLRGPQGTLYGRNATAGAINLITNKPSNKFEASGAIEVGSYNTRMVDGMINVKVNDLLALRAAVSGSKHDGYMRSTQGLARDYDDEDQLSGRLHALFRFSPDLSLLLSADASKIEGAGPGTVPYTTYLNQTGRAQRTASPSIQGVIDNRARGYSAEFKANTSVGELVYQAAHRSFDRNEILPRGFDPAPPAQYISAVADYRQTSHELRLASTWGTWKTIGGLYWFKEESSIDFELLNFPGLHYLAFIQSPTISSSKAAFGDATWSVTPDLHLTVGLRQTKDDKSRMGFSIIGEPVISRGVNDAAVSYSQTTGKLGADYALSKATMVYATLSTGYKAGGFNDGTKASNPFLIYDPEKLTSLEVGLKGRFFNNALQLSGALFNYDYKNLQLTSTAVDRNGAVSSLTRNAAKAKVTGLELEGKVAVSADGKFNFSFTYLDGHYTSYMPNLTTDWSGNSLDKSPRNAIGLGYTHNWNLDGGAAISASLNTRYTGAYLISDFANVQHFRQESFHKTDASVTYTPGMGSWYLQAFVRNIEDKAVMTSYASSPVGNVSLAPPRLAGVRVGASF